MHLWANCNESYRTSRFLVDLISPASPFATASLTCFLATCNKEHKNKNFSNKYRYQNWHIHKNPARMGHNTKCDCCMQTMHSISTVFGIIPSQIISCTCTKFGDYRIKLSNFIKTCVSYNRLTETVDPIWFIFKLTCPWPLLKHIQILVTIESMLQSVPRRHD